MKIAMFGHKMIPSREGGVEVVVSMLASRMAALGHEVTCYNRGGRKTVWENVTVKAVPALRIKGISAVTASFFAAIAASFSMAEVVHIHAEGPAFMSFMPKLFRKKLIVTVHGLDWQRAKWKNDFAAKFIRFGEKMAVRYADEIIVLSRHMQKYFMDTYGRETVYIPNAVPKPEVLSIDMAKERFGLEGDGYILFAGRLVPEKGLHHLIRAFGKIQTEKKLVIAGAASDSADYEKELKKLTEGDARILFTGFCEGRLLAELYSNAAVYVQPSEVEGMPLSLLEAMSYENCCLVSDIPELAEIAEDRAVLFTHGDEDDLARKLRKLLSDEEIRLSYKKKAASFGKYTTEAIVQATLELYR